MIFYYLLIVSLPLVEHAVFARQVGGITVTKYIGAICLLYALMSLAGRRRPLRFFGTPQARAFLAFCLLVLACYVLHGPGPAGAGTGALEAYTSYLAFFVTTLILVDSLERLRRVLLVAIGAMAFASLYVLREWQGGSAVYGAGYRPGYVTGDPNFYAASALLCIPLAFCWVLERRPGPERLYCLGCLVLGLAGSMVAASRGGFLGLMVGLAFLIWHSRRRLRNFAIAGGFVLLFLAFSPTSPLQRFLRPHHSDEEASDVRLLLWSTAWRMIQDRPLTGFGLSSFKYQVVPYADLPENLALAVHNAYLDAAVEMGVPGLVALLTLLYLTLRSLDRLRRETVRTGPALLYQAALGLEAGLIGFAVAMLFVSGLFLKMFWLVLFLSMSLPALRARPAEPRREAA
jgi:O-antigen ligase